MRKKPAAEALFGRGLDPAFLSRIAEYGSLADRDFRRILIRLNHLALASCVFVGLSVIVAAVLLLPVDVGRAGWLFLLLALLIFGALSFGSLVTFSAIAAPVLINRHVRFIEKSLEAIELENELEQQGQSSARLLEIEQENSRLKEEKEELGRDLALAKEENAKLHKKLREAERQVETVGRRSYAQTKAVTRSWFENVWNKRNLYAIEELVTPDAIFYDPATKEYHGLEGARELLSGCWSAFPDAHFSIEEQVAEGDAVATRWTAHATHEGELMGIAPTGKKISVTGIEIMRVLNGKLAGGHIVWDALGLLRQLGGAGAIDVVNTAGFRRGR